MAEPISARQRAILTAILENYIETGEPVGSGTIAGTIARLQADESGVGMGMHIGAGLSSATVRNEMAELAAAGLLEQPHTSAGRVPTAKAFRMYVEQLGGTNRGSAGRSRAQLESRIESSFAGVAGTHAMLERTSHVLATVSSGVGVAVAAVTGAETLEHVHFSRLATSRVLAVVVTQSGQVRDRVLALDSGSAGAGARDLSARELETAANFLNENFRGWSMEGIRAEIGRLVERERSEYQKLIASVQELWGKAVPEGAGPMQTVYVEGVANLVASGNAADRGRLREILAALEAKQRLIELLNAYIDARQDSVRVIFDLEEQAPEMAGLVLIASPARMAGESRGTVGVIGPKRMDYENTMNAVGYIARVFDRMLNSPA
jgi:heat-inducible transcriptional repressor